MIVRGWHLVGHPLFLEQLERLTAAVERARAKDPDGYRTGTNAKLLAALDRLVFERIPADPARPEYRRGGTLGPERRHWFRAKFGSQRFRLFFRYSSEARVIIYAWVNDRDTLRSRGARTDPYAVFSTMLDRDDPPDDWEALLAAAVALDAADEG